MITDSNYTHLEDKLFSTYNDQELLGGAGSLSNDKIKSCKICAVDGFPQKPIIFGSSSSSSNDNINNLIENIGKRFDDIELRIDASQRAIANLLTVLRILQEQLNNLKFQVRNL